MPQLSANFAMALQTRAVLRSDVAEGLVETAVFGGLKQAEAAVKVILCPKPRSSSRGPGSSARRINHVVNDKAGVRIL